MSRVFWVKFLFLSQHLKRDIGFFNFTTLLLIIYSLLQYNIHLCEICCCKCSKVALTFYQNIILGKRMKSINLMKNVGRFTPLSKSPSPIYPQIICTIYPPKSPSTIYPQIVCMLYPQIICTIYPPEIAKSELSSNCLYDLTPPNRKF